MQTEEEKKDRKAETQQKPDAEKTEAAGEQESESPREAEQPGAEPEGGTGENTPRKEPEDLEQKLKKMSEQMEKQKDLLLRTVAEYDNYRKRTAREKASIYSDATAAAVQEVLTVADSLDRALEQRECAAEDMRKGVELVQKQMCSALDKLGVEAMGKEGDPFDPELHNAVSHVEDAESAESVVIKVFQKGYKIGDRVIRHAMVQVAN